jgi:hypothetical protein
MFWSIGQKLVHSNSVGKKRQRTLEDLLLVERVDASFFTFRIDFHEVMKPTRRVGHSLERFSVLNRQADVAPTKGEGGRNSGAVWRVGQDESHKRLRSRFTRSGGGWTTK